MNRYYAYPEELVISILNSDYAETKFGQFRNQ